ncbi:MAG: hypothetical protein ACXWDO_03025 [Bacteroidia bacterium]
MAQSNEKLNQLFDKKWIIKSYVIEGQIFPANDVKPGNYTVFYKDSFAKSKDGGITHLSNWKYDSDKNTITLFSNDSEETTEMEIITLSDSDFTWKTTNSSGMTMKIQMVIQE